MSFTGNLNLDKIDRGLIRFDLAINSFLEKLDSHFEGTDPDVLALGHQSKYISLRPFGTESARLTAKLLSMMNGAGLKLANYIDTPAAGILRWTGSDIEIFDGSDWVSLTLGSGAGTAGFLSKWNSSTVVGDAEFATVVNPLYSVTGTVTVYTVPSGKRALLQGFHWFPASTQAQVWIVPFGGSAADSNKLHGVDSIGSTEYQVNLVLDEGDFIQVTPQSNITFIASIMEYDQGSQFDHFPVIRKGNISTASKDTLYTVPSGKNASPYPGYSPYRIGGGWPLGVSMTAFCTGTNPVLSIYIDDGSEKLVHQQTITDTTKPTIVFPYPYSGSLEEDMILKVQANGAGVNLWVTLIEWP